MNDEYRGIPIADILRVAGLNPDLSTTIGDPRNVAYIGPLENDADEDMAEEMAAVSYGSWREQHGDSDMGFEQCLVDARRMILDEAYSRLFRW
jgi:hypothetical protein